MKREQESFEAALKEAASKIDPCVVLGKFAPRLTEQFAVDALGLRKRQVSALADVVMASSDIRDLRAKEAIVAQLTPMITILLICARSPGVKQEAARAFVQLMLNHTLNFVDAKLKD